MAARFLEIMCEQAAQTPVSAPTVIGDPFTLSANLRSRRIHAGNGSSTCSWKAAESPISMATCATTPLPERCCRTNWPARRH